MEDCRVLIADKLASDDLIRQGIHSSGTLTWTLAQIEFNEARLDEIDSEGVLGFAEEVILDAQRL